ncbi:hypothetical protein SARC_16789, partial [Sphaeroforma arctica JP610]
VVTESNEVEIDETAAYDPKHGPRVGKRSAKVLVLSKQGPSERYGLVVFRTSNTLFVLCAYSDTLASAVGLRFGDESNAMFASDFPNHFSALNDFNVVHCNSL